MDRTDWLWTLGLLLFMLVSAGFLTFTAKWLLSFEFMPFPDYYPNALNPALRQEAMDIALPTEFIGMSLAGNWWILPLMELSLIIATLGEELWWRGYILPRQELVYGNKTWIIHGLLWTSFHLFAPWNIISILPGCLALSYVAQKLKNTWPGIIAHGLANGILITIIIVMGIIN
jgi:membrane protease YdiL (CAAX protease family)